MLESATLAIAGGAIAIVIARWAGPALWRLVLPAGTEISSSQTRIVAATAAIAIVAALVMTILPAVFQRTTRVGDALRGGSRGTSCRTSAVGELLVALQVSLTVVLLVGAGLFVRSLLRVRGLDLGFAAEHVVGVRVNTGRAGRDSAAAAAIIARARDAVQRMPGVNGVALGQSAPFRASMNLPVFLPGREDLPGVGPNRLGYPTFFAVSREYFDVLGIPVLRGRRFTLADQRGSAPVMLVDATMARTFWPGGDAIGQCVRLGADTMPCTTVVGIAEDIVQQDLTSDKRYQYYLPLDQMSPAGGFAVMLRMRGDPAAQQEAVRKALQRVMPGQSYVTVKPFAEIVNTQRRSWQLGATMFVAFGVLALVVAAVGLYGVIGYNVTQRMHELGVRVALGARTPDILRLVVGQGARFAAAGIALGSVLAYGASRWIEPLLFQQSAKDAAIYALVGGVLMLVALAASASPALRAAKADPNTALRSE